MTNRKQVEDCLRCCRHHRSERWWPVVDIAKALDLRPSQVENVLYNNRGDFQRKANACQRLPSRRGATSTVSGWRWRLEGEDEAATTTDE